jgi:pimeloyl-ACP methyl ester carboxylesterase
VPPGFSNRLAHLMAHLIKALRLPRSVAIQAHAVATSPGPPGGYTAEQRHWIAEVLNGRRYPRALLVEQAAFGVLNSELVALRRACPLTPPTLVVSALPGRRTPVRLFWNWKQTRYARFLRADYTPVIPARHFFIVQQPDVAAGLIEEFAGRAVADR